MEGADAAAIRGSRQPVCVDHCAQRGLFFTSARCKQVGVPTAHERVERAEVGFGAWEARRVVFLSRP